MKAFTQLSGVAAALAQANVDTDIIFPARFLLITAREGLGRYAFHDRRFDKDGAEIADFVLNQQPWRDAPILVAGANFGSGSSREQAVWALLGRGIACVIAPSFGEIFFGNCLRNGVLPIRLADEPIGMLTDHAQSGGTLTVDLATQTVSIAGGGIVPFTIDPEARLALLNGWDETTRILNAHSADIAAFERAQRAAQPWLYATESTS